MKSSNITSGSKPGANEARDILFEISVMVGMRGVGYGYTIYGAFEDYTLKDYTLRYHAGFVDMGGFQEDVWVRKGSRKLCSVHAEQPALGGEWGTSAQNEGKEVWVWVADGAFADLQKVKIALEAREIRTINRFVAFFRRWRRN